MTINDNEFDEYAIKVLAPLRQVPSIDPQVATEMKKQFLLQGESLRQGLISQSDVVNQEQRSKVPSDYRAVKPAPLMKSLVAVLLAVFVILVGSTFTVYAAQSSLPGEQLYTIKSWSEDVRLSMTISTTAKLQLTLDYTNRRVDEISSL